MRPPFARVRSTWARLIHRVYEADPLECPKCNGPMRVISLIEDSEVIRRILRYLGLRAPQQPPTPESRTACTRSARIVFERPDLPSRPRHRLKIAARRAEFASFKRGVAKYRPTV